MIELAAITVMKCGRRAGGLELLPVELVHVPPQSIGFGSVELANPLKLLGAEPPLVEAQHLIVSRGSQVLLIQIQSTVAAHGRVQPAIVPARQPFFRISSL